MAQTNDAYIQSLRRRNAEYIERLRHRNDAYVQGLRDNTEQRMGPPLRQEEEIMYRITTWDKANRRWSEDGITNNSADNVFGTEAAAQEQIQTLRSYGEDWASAEYEVEVIPAEELAEIARTEYGLLMIENAKRD